MGNNRNRRARNRRRRRRNRINYKPIIALAVLIIVIVAAIFLVKALWAHDVGDLELVANQGAIYLDSDGSVIYGAAEDFESQEYDQSLLEEQIEQEVERFNEKTASVPGAMELNKFDVSKNVAKVIFSFATQRDFSEYMNQFNRENDFVEKDKKNNPVYEFYLGDVQDYPGTENIDLVAPDKSDATKLESVSGTLILVTGSYQIQIDGTIAYVSDNCSVEGDIVTTAKDEQSYIVYK